MNAVPDDVDQTEKEIAPMDNVQEMLGRALDGFDLRVRAVGEDQWTLVTPCDEWTVRELVNHVVWTQRWTPSLIGRSAPADAGKSFEGDLLGDDPVAAWAYAEAATREAVRQADLDQKISTPYGEMSVDEFLALATAEVCIHTWDLARSVGADETLDPDLVQEVAARYRNDRLYNGSAPGQSWPTIFHPAVDVDSAADPQTQLIALTGRNPKG
jgi:uncharacterized protein (TIGR03086 family)